MKCLEIVTHAKSQNVMIQYGVATWWLFNSMNEETKQWFKC